MKDKLNKFIDALFINAPDTQATRDAKEELLSNVNAKYDDYIASRKDEETALNLTIASIGDISDILTSLGSKVGNTSNTTNEAPHQANEQEQQSVKKRSAAIIAIAVMMFIISPVPLFIFPDVSGLCGLLIMVAAGVGLLVFNGIISKSSEDCSSNSEKIIFDELEELEDNKSNKSLIATLWFAIVAIYFIVSFATMAWHITWIIFLLGPAVQNIILAFTTKSKKKRKNLIIGASWLIITSIYFIISFATMAWNVTWIIFLIGAAVNNAISAAFSD
ncbi:MAG: permease prefix domain 1-containing protein [Acutalibacteraceae bacterium]